MKILYALLMTASSLFAQADYSTLLLLNQTATSYSYPLNQTDTNAYAAWSAGRPLTNGYTAAMGLVVRSSDGTTNYITWGGTSANISALESFSAGGDVYLTNLFGQVGASRNAVQGNTNLCPRVVTNGVAVTANGQLAMLFGRNNYLTTAALSPALPISYIVGVYNRSRTSGDVIFSGNSGTRTALKQGATAVYRIDSGAALDSSDALTTGQWDAITAVFTSGNDSVQVDSGTPTSGSAGNTAPTAFVIGFPTTGADMIVTDIYVWNALMPDAAGTGPVRTNMATFYAFP